MLTMSESVTDFAAAMAKVQAEIGGAVKDSVNPAFRSKYADLGAVWDAWQPIGPKHGFAVMQFPGVFDPEAKTMGMDQLITHASGQWVSGSMTIPLSKVDAQGYGSACTYARRYALSAGVGICPEDDDGNAASQRPAHDPTPAKGITAAQCADLRKLLKQADSGEEAFVEWLKCGTLPELAPAQFDRAKKALTDRIARMVEAKVKTAPASDILDDEIPY